MTKGGRRRGYKHYGHKRRGSAIKNPAHALQQEVKLLMTQTKVLRNIQDGVYSQTLACQNFVARINQLPQDKVCTIKDLNIKIVGDLIHPINQYCFIFTLFFGLVLIFPLFFMCCNWWKKIAYPAYQVPYQIYQELQRFLMKISQLQNFTLTVVDSTFNKKKAQILHKICTEKSIKNFTLKNRALAVNYNEFQVDDFHDSARELKVINPGYQMLWRDEAQE